MQWVTGALSLEVKRLGHEADYSPPSSAEVKNAWSYNSTPPIRLHGVVFSLKKARVQVSLYLSVICMGMKLDLSLYGKNID
jgi:hypothetical protein